MQSGIGGMAPAQLGGSQQPGSYKNLYTKNRRLNIDLKKSPYVKNQALLNNRFNHMSAANLGGVKFTMNPNNFSQKSSHGKFQTNEYGRNVKSSGPNIQPTRNSPAEIAHQKRMLNLMNERIGKERSLSPRK
jgi:hypothetical protein